MESRSTLQCALISVTDDNLSLEDLRIIKHVVDDLVSQKSSHHEEPRTEDEPNLIQEKRRYTARLIYAHYRDHHAYHFCNTCPKCRDEIK